MKIRDFRIDKYEDGYLAHGWLSADSFEFNGNSEQYVYIEVENIKKAGPGGSFLTDDLTLNLLRGGEFFSNDLFDFSGDFGKGPSLLEQAHQKTEDLISKFKSPLPERVQEEIRGYFRNGKGII